ncbi:MAG: aminotransferase class III-fold pyridoxal phosphate-dependent enzyme, partial [Bradymonadaceae bacterium]
GGGMPLGATIATERAFEGWTLGSHASTFGGNPLASRAANTVLQVIEREDLCENVRERGAQLRDGLDQLAETYSVIEDVRGRGLMVGAECREGASSIMDHCIDQGLLVNTAGKNTLRFVPPLIAAKSDVSEALNRLESALEAWQADNE